jgi:hypothetical protein
MRSDLDDRLRGLYRVPATEGQPEHQAAHEAELLAAVARRRGPERHGWSWLRLPRLALAGVLGVAVAVGACVMPAEYPVSLGYGFVASLPAERWSEVDAKALARHLEACEGVERVEIRGVQMHHERIVDDGPLAAEDAMRIQVLVFGEALDTEALHDDLQASFPELEGLELHEVPLDATVHGTLGGMLSHRFLDVVIDRHGVEEAERQVLAGLVAEGMAPEDVEVDITELEGEDGERRIEVRVKAEHTEHLR